MPNIWTHMLFCEDVVDSIKNPNPFSSDESYMKLGAQGPDPFFYYNFWPWIKEEPVHDIGMALHTKHCGTFLMDLITAAKHSNNHVRAYVFGFVTHHILDRNAHPYIHYRAGYEGNDHQRLEVLIDTLMMEKYHHMKTWKAPVYKEIDVGHSLDKDIVDLLYTAIKAHYPQIAREDNAYIQKSYRDMKLALKLLADPHGWKNALLKPLISAYSHQPIKDQVDYLNLNETTWYHPATNDPCTKTFIDLYEQGRAEALEIMTLVLHYWQNHDMKTEQKITDLISDISYDTGKPLSLNLQNKYSEPIV
ncbi:zinc dependent phospholipase C family protein [Lentibacillus sp. Marseille-P4043]|uniref:zinc dependent phospholipase C family protein n=1 Tax=Lentibacillus sp. Marseille-P4043 TaxID=2040293 RepID=UPI000D0BDA1E|nr:zinc dependent phospholipase C family protein [Lentibacillus sp. Marseille-P4043]